MGLSIRLTKGQTVILDCCHSGSGTRGKDDLVRGIGPVNGKISPELDRHLWIGFESSKGLERGTDVNADYTHRGLKSHVLLAACGSEESAIERKGRGLFTQGLLDTLRTSEIDKLTYARLLQRIPLLPSG